MLSDGEDTSSLVSFDEVLELAKRSETAIYSIGLRSRGPERARGSFNESDFVLRQLAQETGGKAYFARAATELTGIYEQISDELSSQYMVGYSSKNPKRDGAWRRIVVRVQRPAQPRAPSRATTGPPRRAPTPTTETQRARKDARSPRMVSSRCHSAVCLLVLPRVSVDWRTCLAYHRALCHAARSI